MRLRVLVWGTIAHNIPRANRIVVSSFFHVFDYAIVKIEQGVKDMAKRRAGNHNGRKRKDGSVFGAKHLDRNFDVSNASHIDAERCSENTYWMNPSFGFTAETFDEFEKKFYECHFADFIKRTNEKAIKQRHFERMIDVDSMRANPRTCLEETLIYFGNSKCEKLPRETFDSMMQELVDYIHERFPNCKVVDYAIHRDEQGAEHGEMRMAWLAQKDGILIMNQTKALEQMGFQNNKKRNDNAKIEFTKMIRQKQIEIARSHGLEIETVPRGKGGLDLVEYQLEQAQQKLEDCQRLVVPEQRVQEIKDKARSNKFNKDEVVLPREMFDELVQTAVQCDVYRADNYRLKRERDEPKDYEKAVRGLNNRINNLERMVNALERIQTRMLDFFETFLHRRNIDVADFKLEYKEMEFAEQQREKNRRSHFFETVLDAEQNYDEIVHHHRH